MLTGVPQSAYRAGWARIVLAFSALTVLPALSPGTGALWPVFAVYLVTSSIFQILIRKGIGPTWRPILGGAVDIALLTFIVHRLGSVSTPLVSIYIFIGIINALVVGRRAASLLAGFGVLAYGGVLVLELLGVLPYGPDAPPWARANAPGTDDALTSLVVVSVLLGVSTLAVARLTRELEDREHELMEANAKLEEMSQRDPLTQLFNRRHLSARISTELHRVRRGHPAVLMMIDLDHFKPVNDDRGHVVGDDLLRQIASALAGGVRATDEVGRYGGDEFVVLLSDTNLDEAQIVGKRLVQAIESVGTAFDADHAVTASIGLAAAQADDTVASLVRRADEMTYRAKRQGGNRLAHAS